MRSINFALAFKTAVLFGLILASAASLAWTPVNNGVSWFQDNATARFASSLPNPPYGFASVSDSLAGSGVTLPAIAGNNTSTGTALRVDGVNSNSYATAVTNNDYVYSTFTLASTTETLRLAQFIHNQSTNGANGNPAQPTDATLAVAIWDPRGAGTLTRLSPADIALYGSTSVQTIALNSLVLVPGVNYEIRFYFYRTGSTASSTLYVDNQRLNVQMSNPYIRVQKAPTIGNGGRIVAADQFTMQVKDGAGTVLAPPPQTMVNDAAPLAPITYNATTQGATTAVTANTGVIYFHLARSGSTYQISEVMSGVAGQSPLSLYSQTVACTNGNAAGTNVSAIQLNKSFSVQTQDEIVCTITNRQKPAVQVEKTWTASTPGDTVTLAITGTGLTPTGGNSTAPNPTGTTGNAPATATGTGTILATFTETYGSTAQKAAYYPTATCVLNNTGASQAVTRIADPSATQVAWTVSRPGTTGVTCTINNAKRPTLTVRKISNASTGTFSFTGDNGIANHSVTTVSPGAGADGAPQVLTQPGLATTINESNSANFRLVDASCTGLGAGGTQTPTLGSSSANGGKVVLDAAATAAGSNIVCTFTNNLLAGISITKTNTPAQGSADLPSDTVAKGVSTTYTVEVSNTGPGTVSNAAVTDTATSPGLSNCAVVANSCTTTGTATCPAAADLTYANLSSPSGVAIPSMATGSKVTFQVRCMVD